MPSLRHVGFCALAGSISLVVAPAATGGVAILDDDPATLAAAAGPQPGGLPGVAGDARVLQLATDPPILPASRQMASVRSRDLLGLGPEAMAGVLRSAIASSGARRALVDDLGAEFRGREGTALAAALDRLAGERLVTAKGSEALSRRVHLSVPQPAALLLGPDWAGARLALTRAGGAWLRTSPAWTPAQWATWPSETGRLLARGGSSAARAHVVFGGGDQEVAWGLARTGSACRVLLNGPGGRRLGASVTAFVTELRRTFRPSRLDVPAGCTPGAALSDASARALEGVAAREPAGLGLATAVVSPPLVAGQPAQLVVQLGQDPLGLAAAAGLTPEQLWSAGALVLETRAPGVVARSVVDGDGSARVDFTPAAPGSVTMTLQVTHAVADRMAGAPPGGAAEVAVALRRVGATALIDRVVAAPGAWRIDLALAPPEGLPGDPLATVIAPPA